MTRMKRLADSPETFISVGFRRLDGARRHVGVCFRAPHAGEGMFELRFHHELVESPLHEHYWLAILDIHPLRVPAIVGTIRKIVARSGEIVPYGPSYPEGDCFDRDSGAWLLSPTGHGLTCATFVVAALRLVGVDLLQVREWRARADDSNFRSWVVEILREHGHTEQADWVQANDRGTRIRPEEVAGAALAPAADWPLGFERAARAGEQVLAQVPALDGTRSGEAP
jgi:hypothetical protein